MKKKRYTYMVGDYTKWFPVGEPIPLHCGFEREWIKHKFATHKEAHDALRVALESRNVAGFILKRKTGGRWHVAHVIDK
jgi:hypothetical protein